jgi:Tfp pilus assembly protein PilN
MKAVNLIPAEQRRGLGGSGSGLAAYVVLGLLALIVAMSAAYTLANRSLSDKRDKLASVQQQAQAYQDRAQGLAGYTSFSGLRQKRSETVRSLATSRFDWSHALHEVARTIPSDAWLTSMRGTVSPGTSVDGGSNDPLRGSYPGPALELVGCTTSQDKVAAVISSLRRIDGVQRVSLSSSAKIDNSSGSGAGGGGSGDGDCRNGDVRFPEFSLTLAFNAPSAPGTTPPTQGTTP